MYKVEFFDIKALNETVDVVLVGHHKCMRVSLVFAMEHKVYFIMPYFICGDLRALRISRRHILGRSCEQYFLIIKLSFDFLLMLFFVLF
jgi:hypothetical protein